MRNKILLVAIILIGVMVTSCRYVNDASDTLYQETKVSTLLKKYELFKDKAASLDAKSADIKVYEGRFQNLQDQYKGVARKDWAKDDREQYNQWNAEVAGVKASYNTLASRYNADMAKINYAFCNVGQLPQGATQTLPREYKPYIEK